MLVANKRRIIDSLNNFCLIEIINCIVNEGRSDPVIPFKVERLRDEPNSLGSLMLMIGGDGPNGKGIEVITGKGKRVVRYEIDGF